MALPLSNGSFFRDLRNIKMQQFKGDLRGCFKGRSKMSSSGSPSAKSQDTGYSEVLFGNLQQRTSVVIGNFLLSKRGRICACGGTAITLVSVFTVGYCRDMRIFRDERHGMTGHDLKIFGR